VLVSHIFYTLWMVECCAINEPRRLEYMSWFLCGNHKSGDLCCMSCASSLMFVGLCMLFVNMLVKLLYVFGGRGITKVCAIRLWPRGECMFLGWHLSSLCLLFSVKLQLKSYVPSHACHYVIMSLGVVIGVVNGWAWDKVTTQS
jgi:hypothetical protein